MDVTDVLRDRMQQPGGLQRMLTVSVTAHALLAAVVIFAPGGLLHHSTTAPTVMTISLGGGGERAENGGMTPMGGRPIQEVKQPDEPVKREPVRPPAAKAPEMTMPLPNAKPTKAAAAPAPKAVKSAPEEARGRTPTRGDKVTAGSTVADTGVRGQGFGLSSGGGPGSGSVLDVADFCCPEYITMMMVQIKRAWNMNQGASGQSTIKFTIQRDGRLGDVTVYQSSGIATLDLAAQRAVIQARQLPPLPDAFPNPTLGVRLTFNYQ